MGLKLEFRQARSDSARFDPMTAWLLGPGREFANFFHDSLGDLKNYRHVVAIDEAAPLSSIQDGHSVVQELVPDSLIDGVLSLSEFAERIDQSHRFERPRYFLLPLEDQALPDSLRLFKRENTPVTLTGRPPVIGIIDHAINLAHLRFRDTDTTTRIDRAWDQAGQFDASGQVPFGREVTAQDINTALEQANGDEETVLRDLGLVNFGGGRSPALALANSHGTHVLDLAGGAGEIDRREAPRLLAVNLPPVVARETTGSLLGIFFLLGVDFILQRAREVAGNAPVFINFSFAVSGGPRDGQHVLSKSLDNLIRQHNELGGGKVKVIVAAGNRNLSQGHAVQKSGDNGSSASFAWHLQPGDPSANMLDIWVVAKSGPRPETFELHLNAPDGSTISNRFALDESVSWIQSADGDVVGRLSVLHMNDDTGDTHEFRISLILASTDPGQSIRHPCPPGQWKIILDINANADFAAWVMRDDVVPGFRDTGRQSYLVDPGSQRRSHRGDLIQEDEDPPRSVLRRSGMMNVLATGASDHVVSVGGAVGQSATSKPAPFAAPYSAAPLPKGSPFGTDERIHVSGVSDRSLLQPGVLAAGTMSGTRRAMNGTSVAAPIVLRALLDRSLVLDSGSTAISHRIGQGVVDPPETI